MRQTILALALLIPSVGVAQECAIPDSNQLREGQRAIISVVMAGFLEAESTITTLVDLRAAIAEIQTADQDSEHYKEALLGALDQLIANSRDIAALREQNCTNAIEMIEIALGGW